MRDARGSVGAAKDNTLLILAPVAIPEPAAEAPELPRKFVDGIRAFAGLWNGRVTLLLPKAARRDENLDYVSVLRRELEFDVHTLPYDADGMRVMLEGAALVLVPLVHLYAHVPSLCANLGVPVVCDADYTPAIRRDNVRASTRNPILRWRRLWWLRRMEPRYRVMIQRAAGAQLLGVPAYETYAKLNRMPLLYFDTRVRRAMLVTEEQMKARAERLRAGAPLRLVYSGRLNAAKGADDLLRVAGALRRRAVKFSFDIFGDGNLAGQMRRAVDGPGWKKVHLHGAVPFPELMRFVTNESDLFVCCHRQGDPSTTFIETMSAGVPLVGYAREGLREIVSPAQAGWVSPCDDVEALAARITELDGARETLVAGAYAAAGFTRSKSFEETMSRRVNHLRAVAEKAAD